MISWLLWRNVVGFWSSLVLLSYKEDVPKLVWSTVYFKTEITTSVNPIFFMWIYRKVWCDFEVRTDTSLKRCRLSQPISTNIVIFFGQLNLGVLEVCSISKVSSFNCGGIFSENWIVREVSFSATRLQLTRRMEGWEYPSVGGNSIPSHCSTLIEHGWCWWRWFLVICRSKCERSYFVKW